MHKAQAELIYVVDGGCTLITGGTLKEPKDNGANLAGTGIAGGTPRKVAKGDYILVPPDTPHWYTDVQGELRSRDAAHADGAVANVGPRGGPPR